MQSTREPRTNPADFAEDVAISALVERVIDGMHQLATEEAGLVREELESDARALARAVTLLAVAGVCAAASLAWAGVALALGAGPDTTALLALTALGAGTASGATLTALRLAPSTVLGTSRARVQARVPRLRASLR